MHQRRRCITVYLLVRVRGTTDAFERKPFRAHATSPHHAEVMARQYAEQFYEIGRPN